MINSLLYSTQQTPDIFLPIFISILVAVGWTAMMSVIEWVWLCCGKKYYSMPRACPKNLALRTGLNKFGRVFVTILIRIINPIWTIFCFIWYICTVGSVNEFYGTSADD